MEESIENPETRQRPYDADFFEALEDGVARSAEACADLMVELFDPRSVVDIGCGTGIWLSALRKRGIADVLGVDGPWVPREQLAIPEAQFREHDLTMPLEIARRFDLALCLETAEHLVPECACSLIGTLAALAPVVVFSAAVPGQGGNGHVNEQWPEYWVDLFAAHGFTCFTGLREQIWHLGAVEVWYRQNMLCFAAPTHAPDLAQRLSSVAKGSGPPLDIVHPDLLERVRRDQVRQADYAARLERELQATQDEMRRTAQRLRHTAQELQRIRSFLPYRIYQRVRAARAAARRLIGGASRSDRSGQ